MLVRWLVTMELRVKKTRAHHKYITEEGKVVPGATTVIANLGWNKQVLMNWAKREALKGNDPDKLKEAAADIGTCAHYMCECDAKEVQADLTEYSEVTIKVAKKCFKGYLDWKKAYGIVDITSEIAVVDSKLEYGGMIDLLCTNGEGKRILADIKTSSGVYPDHRIQLAAYHHLLVENGYSIDDTFILHLGKNGDFTAYKLGDLSLYWEAFECCLRLHKLKHQLGG